MLPATASPLMSRLTSAAPAPCTRGSSEAGQHGVATVDVLLPTCDRLASLGMNLGGVATQTITDLRVIVADQSAHAVSEDPVVQTLGRVIEERGGAVGWHHRLP